MSSLLTKHNAKRPETQWVTRLLERDKSALAEVYDAYSASLYGVILKIVGEAAMAEDVLQEAFMKVWNKIDYYDANKARLFTWLLNIARRTAIDKTRTSHFKRKKERPKEAEKQEASFQPIIEHLDVKEMVSRLRPEYQTIIDLMYFHGYSQSEVAKRLNLPLGTVKSRSRAAIVQLRKVFKE